MSFKDKLKANNNDISLIVTLSANTLSVSRET